MEKHKAREMFTVVDIKDDGLLSVKKTESQFRAQNHLIRPAEAILVSAPSNDMMKDDFTPDTPTDKDRPISTPKPDPVKGNRPQRQAAIRARHKVRDMIRRLTASHAEY